MENNRVGNWHSFVTAMGAEMGLLPRSLRARIATLFGLLAFLVGVPSYFYTSHLYLQQLSSDRRERLQVIASSAATIVGQSLVERRREVALLAESPLLKTEDLGSSNIRNSLELLRLSQTHYSWIGVADIQGTVTASTSGHLNGQSVQARPWFQNGLDHVFVGDLHEAVLLAKLLAPGQAGQPLRFIDFAAPIRGPSGELRGVIGAHAHWRWANEVMALAADTSTTKESSNMFIVNKLGKVIYPSDGPQPNSVPAGNLDALDFHAWEDGGEYLTVAAKIPEPTPESPLGWKIYVRYPKSMVIAAVANLQQVEFLASLIAGITFLMFAWICADRISRPLEQLSDIARRIQSGQEAQKFDVQSTSTEIVHLQSALSDMSGTLVARKAALERSNHELEARVLARTAELETANRALERLAKTDTLTGLPNRLASNEVLHYEFAQMKRGKQAYSVLLADIDSFKAINDTWGHPAGDLVLKHVAGVLRGALRETDFVGRVGGEEFLMILPMTDHNTALQVAEKVRAAVEASPVKPVPRVTISIGLEQAYSAQKDEQEAVASADEWLYQAKQRGRNRIESLWT
ncbi:MAG: GGDEF domain-containing protein [Burkholderiales bacterium PBB4]|nr:MAG: GGDEF domain-containing protein [Burkholderiales bacterium PBB4]